MFTTVTYNCYEGVITGGDYEQPSELMLERFGPFERPAAVTWRRREDKTIFYFRKKALEFILKPRHDCSPSLTRKWGNYSNKVDLSTYDGKLAFDFYRSGDKAHSGHFPLVNRYVRVKSWQLSRFLRHDGARLPSEEGTVNFSSIRYLQVNLSFRGDPVPDDELPETYDDFLAGELESDYKMKIVERYQKVYLEGERF